MESKIVGQIKPVDYDPDFFESNPFPIPYFDNKELKIGFVEAKHEPYLLMADNILQNFLSLDKQDRNRDSQIVFHYYSEILKYGYTKPLNVNDITDIWNFVYPSEIIVHWDENADFYLCVSCGCEWEAFKDSIFRSHQIQIAEIFKKHGFVGYDLAGKSGSNNFWLIVQHSDHKPEFQKEVLKKMKTEVEKGNADSETYGLLVDRVKLNTGQNQSYGTQVAYNPKTGQAYPRKLADSATVNQRRKSIGLEPLEIYLNRMTIMHFDMNKEDFSKKGITEPKLYKTKE